MTLPPAYDVNSSMKLRAGAVAAAIGLVAGSLWRLLPPIGYFVLIPAAGLGFLMGDAIERVTKRKRGYVLQMIAGFGLLLAYFVRNLLLKGIPVLDGDVPGYLAVAAAIIAAINLLR